MTTILQDCAELKELAEIMAKDIADGKEHKKKVDAWFDDIFKAGRERRAHTAESAIHCANTELWRQIEEHRLGGSE
jgi:hypothetical protein